MTRLNGVNQTLCVWTPRASNWLLSTDKEHSFDKNVQQCRKAIPQDTTWKTSRLENHRQYLGVTPSLVIKKFQIFGGKVGLRSTTFIVLHAHNRCTTFPYTYCNKIFNFSYSVWCMGMLCTYYAHAVQLGVVASHHFDSQPHIPGKQLARSPGY